MRIKYIFTFSAKFELKLSIYPRKKLSVSVKHRNETDIRGEIRIPC